MQRSKQQTWADVRVGIIVVLGLAIMIFMILIVGTNILAFSSKYTLHTFVPNVVGLNEGAFITVSGVKAGKIGKFTFTEKDGQFGIAIPLHIEEKHQDKITSSSVATIRTLGILGDKYIEVSLGRADETPLEEGAWLQAKPPLDFEAMADQAETAIQELPGMLTAARELLESMRSGRGTFATMLHDSSAAQHFSQLVRQLSTLTASLNRRDSNVGKLLHDDSVYSNLTSLSANLNSIVSRVQAGEGTLGKLVVDTTVYANLNSVTARSDSLLAHLNSREGTLGKLATDTEAHDRLMKLVAELEAILEDVKKYPQKYFQVKVF